MDNSIKRVSCGALTAADVGANVELDGWVHRRRDHGGLIFIDMRDRSGLTQVTFDPSMGETFARAETLRSEDVVRVGGVVRRRPAGTENAKLATGDVEVPATALEILNRSETPPFVIAAEEEPAEDIRLRYRYLDLRRPRMQRNLKLRHRIVKAIRDYFDEHDFIEIETPNLIKSTPEGARDYLVPSRVHQGSFYALPQSPQILKQILMIGGLGRYMQIARCFRDEGQRADRQPEFTQVDVEMSFVQQDDVVAMMEGCMRSVWRRALGETIPDPLPRLTYGDAMRRFGSDKPDLRFELELADVTDAFVGSAFSLFATLAESIANRIIAVRYPGGAALSRRDFDNLTELVKSYGGKGMAYVTFGDGVKGSIAKFLDEKLVERLRQGLGATGNISGDGQGDALLLIGDTSRAAYEVAGKLRLEIGDRLKLRDPKKFAFCWVLGFPLFERDEETGEITFSHHPFTAPLPGQEALFDSDPLAITAQHYDLVLNGYELGSGSIRNHVPEFQRRVFKRLGLSDEQIDDRFGFFMEALSYGAPPHGGMALGIDRIVMIACGESNIREVIAFPKNQMARDVMMDAPSSVPAQALKELGLAIVEPPSTT
ncbi:MAG: aspartyl-tRNA synthetase [Candidatus Eremiobacteraeota bacterium]|nr:aspartyl-tRNA synthetase [Candidatus Eremiobacteraeota bacterium]